VSPNNIPVTTVNGTGAGIEIIYVLIFIIFAPKKEKIKIFALFTLVLSVFSAVVFVSLFAFHGNHRKAFCGFAMAIFSVIMYGSPLSIMVSQFTAQRFFLSTSKILEHLHKYDS
jgi:solute carrier family 50 (sugar transporter)